MIEERPTDSRLLAGGLSRPIVGDGAVCSGPVRPVVRAENHVRRLLILCSTLLVLCLAAERPAAAQPGAEERFAQALEQWEEVSAALDDLGQQYRAAGRAERPELLARYRAMVEQSQRLLPQLREASLAAYQAAPNADPQVTQTMLGLLSNAIREDRYEDAAELSDALLGGGCDHRALPELAGTTAYCRDNFDRAHELLDQARQSGNLTQQGQSLLEDAGRARQLWQTEQQRRRQEEEQDDLPRVRLVTSQGEVVVELYENEAPQTVGNFVSLVEKNFYDGVVFHRVLPEFMAQSGCPKGDGSGGPGYRIYDECTRPDHRKHFRGVLSMAKTAAPDTGGSQFFLTFRRTPHLDGQHTVFGRVIQGLDVLEKLQRRDPSRPGNLPEPDRIVQAEVLRKRNHDYQPTKVQ
jgi:cyclophilin family peptidyl-prolyl cis-trans isomerase